MNSASSGAYQGQVNGLDITEQGFWNLEFDGGERAILDGGPAGKSHFLPLGPIPDIQDKIAADRPGPFLAGDVQPQLGIIWTGNGDWPPVNINLSPLFVCGGVEKDVIVAPGRLVDVPGDGQSDGEGIAFLAIEDALLQGYRQTLLDHGLPYDKSLVLPVDPSDALKSASQSTVEIINMKPRPTAIFAANDESAISAMAALHDHHVNIPKDMAIVSIDNIRLSGMIRSGLTTIDVPKKRMAMYAMQVLLLQGQFRTQQPASIVVPTELVIRESCGAK
jgi:hypothetical protein